MRRIDQKKLTRQLATLVVAAAAVCARAGPAAAIGIPFQELFYGRTSASLIEDRAFYPDRYMSVESCYWDLYHERRANRLHDYRQSDVRMLAMTNGPRWQLGAETRWTSLVLKQDNVHTDADRLRGERQHVEGRILLGYRTQRPGARWTPSDLELLVGPGWQESFSGVLETRLGWGDAFSLQFLAETFESRLELYEDINGYRFPFIFPYRSERYWARIETTPSRAWRGRLWGSFDTSSGQGEVEKGFENRLWLEQRTVGASVAYRLRRPNRWQRVPRLDGTRSAWPGMRLGVRYTSGDTDMGMHFNGTRYLRLDDLQTGFAAVRLDVMPLSMLSVFGGWERSSIGHHGNSFFDVWPFTVWDVFMAKRYRLAEADVALESWFAGLGFVAEGRRVDFEVSGRFEWLNDTGALEWLERRDILFPFFFEYEGNTKAVDIPFRYMVQVAPAVQWHVVRGMMLRLSGQVTVPFGKEEETSSASAPSSPPPGGSTGAAPTSDDGTTHGGMVGLVEIILGL